MKQHILLLDGIHPSARQRLEKAGHQVSESPALKGSALLEALQSVDGVVVRSATKLTADVIAACPQLKIIGRAGAGVDNIDVPAATDRKIAVVNAPGTNANAVAELVFALLLSLARKIPLADQGTRDGSWPKKACAGTELRGKRLGLVGAGRIGREVLRIAEGFEMERVVSDPLLTREAAANEGWTLLSLDELITTSDIVSLHAPLVDETRHLIDAGRLAKFKQGSWLVNCARGGLIDATALVEALTDDDHPLAAAVLDVYEDEPVGPDNPYAGLNNIVLSPHVGASTAEAQTAAANLVADQLIEFFTTGNLAHSVSA